jgi:hypothetical protein
MPRDDIKALALAFVDRLLTDAPLRDETRSAAAREEPHAEVSRIVSRLFELNPPLSEAETRELGLEMAALYSAMLGLGYPIGIVAYYTGRGAPPPPPGS